MSLEGQSDPLDKFRAILPEGLSQEIGEKLLEDAKAKLNAGETIESIIDEYQAKREEAMPQGDLVAKINEQGVVESVEKKGTE